ncbi:pectate lyase family protein [Agarivorans sp. Z349TD_8]|uniref:pectate lyase family protein n=1 Tax=Agarivorans sp. Z349TD_8 TaxID=3421434 RepID=UPI003D7DE029
MISKTNVGTLKPLGYLLLSVLTLNSNALLAADNLSIGAGSDGSSKASGTSYGNVRDGDLSSYWAPNGSSGRISIKWSSEVSVASVAIVEATSYQGNIGSWQLVNNDDGTVLATGSGAGTINFNAISTKKLNFEILSASGLATVAEFETYSSSGSTTPEQPSFESSLSSSVSNDSVLLNWSVSGIDLASQQIYRDTDADPSGRVRIASGITANTYTDSGLANGTYYYWIKFTDSEGNNYNTDATAATVNVSDDSGNVDLDADCNQLVNDPSINWWESSLQTEQQIVECLATSLGKPVGFGSQTTGGYNPDGGSHLVVITKNSSTSVEQQILNAISSPAYNWIVFDKDDFATDTTVAMYRLGCSNGDVLDALDGASEAECLNPQLWCSNHGVASDECDDTFFNDKLNDKSLNALKIPMIDSNTTLDGRTSKVTFEFSGFKMGADSSGSSTYVTENVIVTNNRFIGVGHTEDHNLDPDMLRSTGESHNIWIHQNTFEHTGDSAFDVKVGAYDISVSFNKLINVKRAALHGSSDSRTVNDQITTTIHNNLFITTDEHFGDSAYNGLRRVPLMRRGQSHMFNNVFYGYRKDLLSVRVGGRIAFEDNMFLNNINNSKGDDMDYWLETLLRDYREGGLEISGSYVWYANANCQLQGNPGDLSASYGTTPDMFSSYDSSSKSVINSNRFSAGDDLAQYSFATAGKGGLTPYLSPAALSTQQVIAQAPSSCQ